MPAKAFKAAVCALVGVSAGHSASGKSDAFLGDAKKLGDAACPELVLAGPFGEKSEDQVTIKAGSASGELACPKGSRNEQGKIKYTCKNGKYETTVGCYDCPKLDTKIALDGYEHFSFIYPGMDGEEHRDDCNFGDKRYKYGAVVHTCLSGQWTLANTCTDSPCPTGTATIDFAGGLGEVEFQVPLATGTLEFDCPSDAPNPQGKVHLHCDEAAAGSKDAGKWEFVSQTCQLCNPMTWKVEFQKLTKDIVVGGGKLNQIFSTPCIFNDGTRFDDGAITYKCHQEGWKLLEVSCANYFCPKATMNVHMKYTDDKQQLVHATTTITVDGGKVGRKHLDCPVVSKDPSKKIVLECEKDGAWKLISADCTGETLHRLGHDSAPKA